MSLENILHKIRTDANEQASAILSEGRARVETILATARGAGEAQARHILTQAESEAAEIEARSLTMARLDARKSILATKQDLISHSFALALQELREMPVPVARDFLRPLMLEAVVTGNEVIVCAEEDRAIFSTSFIEEINHLLNHRSLAGSLSLSTEYRNTGGGFVLVGEDIEINATYPAHLQALKGDLEPMVAHILFK